MASIDSPIPGVLRTASNIPTSFQMILSSKGTEMQQTSQNQRTLLSKNLHGLEQIKVYIYHHEWSLMLKTHYLWAFIVKSTETLKHIYRLENAHHDSFPCSTCFLCQWSTVTCLSLILHWLLEWERTQLECKVTSWVNDKCHKTAHLKLHACCDH